MLAAGVLLAAPAALAQGPAAILVLRGTVPAVSELKLLASDVQVSRDLREPLHDALVTEIVEHSNTRGYAVSFQSASAAQFGAPALVSVNAAVPYQLSYGGEALRFSNGVASLKRQGKDGDATRDLRISTKPVDRVPLGDYIDRLTLVITAP